ncbi:MAG: adenosylcobinamide-GDP ribazoletransferase [Pseudomonadota bacterium]
MFKRFWNCWCESVSFFTIIPTFIKPDIKQRIDGKQSSDFLIAAPLIGLITAALGALTANIILSLDLNAMIGGFCVLGVFIILTGALHEDGLADYMDAIAYHGLIKKRIEIMRDSRLGTFAVIALVLVLALNALSITSILEHPNPTLWLVCFIAAEMSARGWFTSARYLIPPLKSQVSLRHHHIPTLFQALLTLIIAYLFLWIYFSTWSAFLLTLIHCISFAIWVKITHHKLGGINGDCLGALFSFQRILALMALSLLIPAS